VHKNGNCILINKCNILNIVSIDGCILPVVTSCKTWVSCKLMTCHHRYDATR